MSIHSAVLVFEAGCDPSLSLSWLRVLAPELVRLRVLVWASVRSGWWTQARWVQASTRLAEGAQSLQGVAVDICEDVDGDIVVELDEAALDESLDAVAADLLVWGPLTRDGG
ncbi:MAG: hypothetical protein GXP62_03330, partial [Oligoflexia bacterium]|nr:hypothetical protein [Oligoflexia bacterium]